MPETNGRSLEQIQQFWKEAPYADSDIGGTKVTACTRLAEGRVAQIRGRDGIPQRGPQKRAQTIAEAVLTGTAGHVTAACFDIADRAIDARAYLASLLSAAPVDTIICWGAIYWLEEAILIG